MGTPPADVWGYHQAFDAYVGATWELVQAAKAASDLPPELQAIVVKIEEAERALKERYSTVPSPPYLITSASPGLSKTSV